MARGALAGAGCVLNQSKTMLLLCTPMDCTASNANERIPVVTVLNMGARAEETKTNPGLGHSTDKILSQLAYAPCPEPDP